MGGECGRTKMKFRLLRASEELNFQTKMSLCSSQVNAMPRIRDH